MKKSAPPPVSDAEKRKRSLVDRWHGRQHAGDARLVAKIKIEELLDSVTEITEALTKIDDQDEQIEQLKTELEEANDNLKEAEGERDAYAADLEAALVDVKYWLHDGLVHGKLVSKPREILRRIEDLVG